MIACITLGLSQSQCCPQNQTIRRKLNQILDKVPECCRIRYVPGRDMPAIASDHKPHAFVCPWSRWHLWTHLLSYRYLKLWRCWLVIQHLDDVGMLEGWLLHRRYSKIRTADCGRLRGECEGGKRRAKLEHLHWIHNVVFRIWMLQSQAAYVVQRTILLAF